jgi:hypothetical protein
VSISVDIVSDVAIVNIREPDPPYRVTIYPEPVVTPPPVRIVNIPEPCPPIRVDVIPEMWR